MNNRKYWDQREKEKLEEQINDVKLLEIKLKREFNKAYKEIEKEINNLFTRYAKDNQLTYIEASKLLTSKEFKEWRYDIKTYVDMIEQTGDEKLLLELNTLAMKSRISRLEEILYQVNKYINKSYDEVYKGTTKLLEGSVTRSYYKTIYDIQKYVGVGASFANIDEKLIKEILSYPWSGKNYSQRIWGTNRDRLKDILETEMTQMITRGESSRTVAKRVSEVMDVAYERAISLINTEHSYVMSEATSRAFKESGVEKYEFLATLDTRTSKICQSLDGKVFKLSERQVGVNASPMHPRCRSTEIPYIEGDSLSTRFARDKNGKGIEVPSNMKYDEWYKKYVSGGKSSVDDKIVVSSEGNSDILKVGYKFNKKGNIVSTENLKGQHVNIPSKHKPFSVIETDKTSGSYYQVDRTIYDEHGQMIKQIHSGHHNKPKQHPFGEYGEHVHEYVWQDGKIKERITREIKSQEKIENRDILEKE